MTRRNHTNHEQYCLDAVSRDCRTALVWSDDPEEVLFLLNRRPVLRRVYLPATSLAASSKTLTQNYRVRVVPVLHKGHMREQLMHVLRPDTLYFAEGRAGLYIAQAQRTLEPEIARELEQAFLHVVRRFLASVSLRATRGWHILANRLLNLPRCRHAFPITALRGPAEGDTVVVVGAGPSLAYNADLLNGYRERIWIVACDGAWATLHNLGIQPDLVVSTDDSERVWRYFAHIDRATDLTPVACLDKSAWPLFRYHPGPLLVGRPKGSADHAGDIDERDIPEWDTGTCVGHAALECAYLMKAQSIILIGFDLGYRDDAFHPADMPLPYYHLQPPPNGNITHVPGIDGKSVRTDLSMLMYLREFERRIAAHDTTVSDATEGGARIAGTRVTDLESALQECPSRNRDRLLTYGIPFPERKPVDFSQLSASCDALLFDLQNMENRYNLHTALQANTPFMFLHRYPALSELLDPAVNPALKAAFLFCWEDWHNGGVVVDAEIERVARAYINECVVMAKMIRHLVGIRTVSCRQEQGQRPRIMVFPDPELRPEQEQQTIIDSGLAELQPVVYEGDTHDMPRIWKSMAQGGISTAVVFNGVLFPAAWGMPGCACLDIRSRAPEQVVPEYWMPGYALVGTTRNIAEAWRRVLPWDRGVYGFKENNLVSIADGEVLDWREMLTRLEHETQAVAQ